MSTCSSSSTRWRCGSRLATSAGRGRLAAALARAPGATPPHAVALAYLAWLHATHDRQAAVARATEAVRLARELHDRPVLAFALQTLGEHLPDVGAAAAASTEARDLAASAPPAPVRYGPTAGPAVACGATYNLAALYAHRDLPRALQFQREALELAEAGGRPADHRGNAARLAGLHLLAGQPREQQFTCRARPPSSTSPTARWEDIVRWTAALFAHHEQRFTDAETGLRDVLSSARAGGRPLHENLASCALVDLLLERGRTTEAEAVLDAAWRTAGTADALHACRLGVRRAGCFDCTTHVGRGA